MKRPEVRSRSARDYFEDSRRFCYLGLTHEDFLRAVEDESLWEASHNEPMPVRVLDRPHAMFWIYKDFVYCPVDEDISEVEEKLLIIDAFDKERRLFERLRNKYSGLELSNERTKIPESVRIFVWQRDEGKCSRCGSRKNLEYDHIIPVSKGGSNTERNVELLCETCNREKSDHIE